MNILDIQASVEWWTRLLAREYPSETLDVARRIDSAGCPHAIPCPELDRYPEVRQLDLLDKVVRDGVAAALRLAAR